MVRLTKDYVVTTDETCYTLLKDMHSDTLDKKTGVLKHNYKTLGYYSSLENALEGARAYIKRNVIGDKDLTLGQAIQEMRDINMMFKEIVAV